MSNLATAIRQLKQERERALKEVKRLDTALSALSSLDGGRNGLHLIYAHGKRRSLSPDARKRIAAAQKARWAKWRAGKKKQ